MDTEPNTAYAARGTAKQHKAVQNSHAELGFLSGLNRRSGRCQATRSRIVRGS